MTTDRAGVSTPVVLQLDVTVAFEALILNELRHRPAARQAEWLRGLLVQGFLVERRALQAVSTVGTRSTATSDPAVTPAPSPAMALVTKARTSSPLGTAGKDEPMSDVSDETPPSAFAALRKVIG